MSWADGTGCHRGWAMSRDDGIWLSPAVDNVKGGWIWLFPTLGDVLGCWDCLSQAERCPGLLGLSVTG